MSLLKDKKEQEIINEVVEDFEREIKKQDAKGYEAIVRLTPLNVRNNPTLSGKIISTLNEKDVVVIVEEKESWGKLATGGWILLSYVDKK